ncbi:MAG TPA: GNAT family N-acetyltransferase [Acidimicrobiia bacterium]|nr:GNAT family N-acetyltransferase [Acidimicrobiia bacterium]
MPSVHHNRERSRYEIVVDDTVVGFADYRRRDGVVVFPHTVIDPPHRRGGLGAVLVRGALDDVRRSGARVVPLCWYVAHFVDENPEYRDLLAA